MKLADKSAAPQKEEYTSNASERSRAELFLIAFLDVAFVLGDLLALNAAFLAAYFLRYILQVGGEIPGEFDVSYPDYVPIQAGMTGILMITYVLKGMYRLPRGVSVSYTHLRAHETRHDLVC